MAVAQRRHAHGMHGRVQHDVCAVFGPGRCQDAKDAGFSLLELHAAGYVEGVKAAGYTLAEAAPRVWR